MSYRELMRVLSWPNRIELTIFHVLRMFRF